MNANLGAKLTKPFFSYELAKEARMLVPGMPFHSNVMFACKARGHIFSHVRPFYERAVRNLDGSMHRSL